VITDTVTDTVAFLLPCLFTAVATVTLMGVLPLFLLWFRTTVSTDTPTDTLSTGFLRSFPVDVKKTAFFGPIV
jgi:hypothetical protein